jgi:hypothetical protein
VDLDKAENEIKENTKPDIPSIAAAPTAPAAAPAAPVATPAAPAATPVALAAAPAALVATPASTGTAIPGLLS